MCLAVPMRVMEKTGDTVLVEYNNVTQKVNCTLLADVDIDDYVIVHAGFAIQKLDSASARETLKIFDEIYTKNY